MTTRDQTYASGTDRMAALVNDLLRRLELLELRAPIPGPAGAPGAPGAAGPPGPEGPVNPNATFATEADHTTGGTQAGAARYADGPTSAAYGREVAGGGFFAVWMDSGLRFARNTSSRRYKRNIKDHRVDPARVLALRPRAFHRRSAEGEGPEYGLIAEEVQPLLPELVTYFDGRVDGLRYDLLAVALLDVCRSLAERVEALEGAHRV